MCMFTRAVRDVADTRMFARLAGDNRQMLVYQMSVQIEEALAMVLPLPVPPDTGENAIQFINLEKFPGFFEDVGEAVPVWVDERRVRVETGEFATLSANEPAVAMLTVHAVGRYEASFVPRVRDFERLDPRFRLSPGILKDLGLYDDWGFAVFKLRESGAGKREAVHPMAFSFPTRHRFSMFFPTVHVHDGKVQATARFDHLLYFQAWVSHKAGSLWYRNGEPVDEGAVPTWPEDVQYTKAWYRMADEFGKILPDDAHFGRLRWGRLAPMGPGEALVQSGAGVLEPGVPIIGLGLSGTLKNRDTWFHVDAL